MKTKINLIFCCAVVILLSAALGTLHAQGQTAGSINQNSQSFTQKVNMSNVGNKDDDGLYYLLLCKLLPNVSTKIFGALKIESYTKDICDIEIDVFLNALSDNNKNDINNLCNIVNVRIVTVQYGGEEHIAIELIGIKNISDISFTGYAENKSLLLVNENAVEIINDTIGNGTRAGDPWTTSGNNIYNTNSGNVGIGNSSPPYKAVISNGSSGLEIDPTGVQFAEGIGIQTYNRVANQYTPFQIYSSKLILGGGNVGIGTSNPTQKLHVSGNMYLNGNMGIGISTPDATLDISGNRGTTNSRNFRVLYSNGGNLTNTEFSALTHVSTLAGGNGWTALYAKQGSAAKAGVFEGDVRITGTLKAGEVIASVNGADFVFDDDYRLRTLAEVEEFINTNKHLPDITPASEMEQNGLNMGEFQIQLLQKIEELTLYVIELKKENEMQQKRIEELEKTNKN